MSVNESHEASRLKGKRSRWSGVTARYLRPADVLDSSTTGPQLTNIASTRSVVGLAQDLVEEIREAMFEYGQHCR